MAGLWDNKHKVIYTGCNSSNRISYKTFCLLGGVDNKRLVKVHRNNGAHHYTTYHMMDLERSN